MTKGVWVIESRVREDVQDADFLSNWRPLEACVGRPAAEELIRAYDNRPSMWIYKLTRYVPEVKSGV